ncbi:MAG: FAD-dependent oxidoreductase [Pseudomonadota bacterium]
MKDVKESPQADVVVLGAGLAGLCAARAAAESGASVMLLEKSAGPGGSTLMSAGSFALAGTDLQAAAGVKDTPDGLEAELHKVAGGKADPALVRLYVEQQADAYEWLKRQGVVFHKVSLSSGTAVPRTHPTDPRQLIEALQARVRETRAIALATGAAATRLLVDGDPRRVVGVEYTHEGRTAVVRTGGVVIATGGFTRNRDLVQKFAPELAQAPAWGGEGNTGDGLTMAWELGADLVDMGYVTGTFGVAINHYPEVDVRKGDELLLRMAMYRGGIAVNLDGKRFADESQSYKVLATRCLAQPKAIAFQVFDQSVMNQSAPVPTVNDLKGALAKGAIRQADTLRELAQQVGLDPQALESTVARYNELVRQGEDVDFGRKTLGGGFGTPVLLETPPWYILPCSAALLSTYCGLRVDTAMRVQDVRHRTIARLYAAGEVVGGFHGAGYMSGSSLGKAVIFGRIAGRSAAAA